MFAAVVLPENGQFSSSSYLVGYDLSLTRDYFEQRLNQHFPKTDAALLYDTWKSSSQVVSWVDRFFFRVNDFQFAPEACVYNGGFLTIDESFFSYPPLRGSGILSVQEYAKTVIADEEFGGITPMEVADNLDGLSEKTLSAIEKLRKMDPGNNEYQATLTDMESMSALGRYYADKIRGAAELAIFREDNSREQHHSMAVEHLTDAVSDWESYASIASAQSESQLLSRSSYLDWWKLLEDVKQEVETVRQMK